MNIRGYMLIYIPYKKQDNGYFKRLWRIKNKEKEKK